MTNMIYLLLTAVLSVNLVYGQQNDTFLGCYIERSSARTLLLEQDLNFQQCLQNCKTKYYRYAMIRINSTCVCGNYVGEKASDDNCTKFCESCDLKPTLLDVYSTRIKASGPPRNFVITDVTDRSIRISWQEPDSFVEIASYKIKANVLKTFSNYAPISPEWMYSNNTFQTSIITLQPGTKYNITLCTYYPPNNYGAEVFKIIETEIGEPDNLPNQPKIVENNGDKIKIKMSPVQNNNGPISAYVIVVFSEDNVSFDPKNIKSYQESKTNGDTYYITAEIKPAAVTKEFIVGDGKYYGKYFNTPLDSKINYNIRLGVVSTLNGITKVAYSAPSNVRNGVLVLNVNKDSQKTPGVIVGLSIAIGLLSFMLIAGIIGFIILKSHIANRRQHFSENQELTLQGPMIEIENSGYIHEDDHPMPVNHYANLKQKLRSIPPNNLKIEPTNLLGIGKFGRVNSGTLHENNTFVPVAVYSIADKKLTTEDRKIMLRELDLLIKTGKHDNIIGLIGTSETSHLLCVAMEYISMNLKDLLLGSRDALPGRFSNMSETQAFNIAIQIAQGMAHLENHKIVHKQLCARSILVANGFIPKISGYGLAQYYTHNKMPDCTRWMALELHKGMPPTSKSDTWSFACMFWEICVLGGTPYGIVPNNNEIPEKIIRGLRLPQLQYFSDDLYQIMLDCWQIDIDERPSFVELAESIENLKEVNFIPHLNFNQYPNFQYEQFYPDMELAVRPVF